MFTTSRRGFLQGAGAIAAMGATGVGFAAPTQKIRLAAVGVMGKGYSDWMPMIKSGLAELVAWCDADANKRNDAINHKNTKKIPGLAEKLAKVPFYTDYRKMLDDQSKLHIDAMTVSTPDHMHAAVAVRAMKMGIHVYVQKPLVRTIWEAHQFFDAAKANNVVTQMGNQGSGGDGFRRNVEVVQSGILGDVTEVHVWTNRPIWPQGFTAMKAATTREVVAVPPGLDWNAWLGVAAGRPYRKPYDKGTPEARFNTGIFHAFNWRGYFDFGAGAFGDMACHTMNLPFRGLELGVVTRRPHARRGRHAAVRRQGAAHRLPHRGLQGHPLLLRRLRPAGLHRPQGRGRGEGRQGPRGVQGDPRAHPAPHRRRRRRHGQELGRRLARGRRTLHRVP